MKERDIIWTARILSIVFTPFYLPILGLIVLFTFSYLSLLPLTYKLWVTAIVWFFTILLPSLLINLYRRYQGWTLLELGVKERRVVPYLLSIACYLCCFHLMDSLHIPRFVGSILMAALMVQVVCALVNLWWKISTHSAAIGGVTGALLAFSLIFMFNPVWFLCLSILVGGLVGTSRMILRQHSLAQVIMGYFIGVLTAFTNIIFI